MKVLIACYSYGGNTLKVAEELKKNLDGDLTKIEPVKDRFYLLKGWGAFREQRAAIKPCTTDMSDYDALVVCCPVWAGKSPAGLNQYLDELQNVEGKKLGAFVTMGGNGNQKATIQIREALAERGMEFLGQMKISGKDLKSGNYNEMVETFAKKFQDA
ncbi:NADPH-dependent FMN reductase [anaerobic digester metagenome]